MKIDYSKYDGVLDHLLKQQLLNKDWNNAEGDLLAEAISESILKGKLPFWFRLKMALKSKWVLAVGFTIIACGSLFFLNPKESEIKKEVVAFDSLVHTKELPSRTQLDTLSFIPSKSVKYELNAQEMKPRSANLQMQYSFQETREVETPLVLDVPELTQAEKEENIKRKIAMTKQLTRLDKSAYAFVEVEDQLLNQNTEAVGRYYISKTEVSNIEYKTFLFDLLIQGKVEAFLEARPDYAQWQNVDSTAFVKDMAKLYFSHPSYNDYPVVNVSRQGARMYCRWLYSLLKGEDKQKHKIDLVRLPTETEWTIAAKGGLTHAVYPWGGPDLRNEEGCCLANFYPSNGNYVEDGALFTAKVESYSPNGYGIYNMSGNVAEMVDYANGEIGSKGGSWKDSGQFLKIEGKDPYKGNSEASPFIGFRPVVIINDYLNYLLKKTSLQNEIDFKSNTSFNSEYLKQIEEFNKFASKHNFQLVEGGYIYLNGKAEFIAPFYIKTTEVSNAEYADFLKAIKPELNKSDYESLIPSKGWKVEPFNAYYFEHPAYQNYPCVNISLEGAKAYCNWLTETLSRLLKEINKDHLRPLRIKVGLPSSTEWMAAATNFDPEKIYPWNGKGLRNADRKYHGMYLANFKSDNNDSLVVAGQLNDNAEVTAPVHSYWPNELGLYNMSGNVSEMVSYPHNLWGTKGGSWQTAKEALSIHYTDVHKGEIKPASDIGFRPVIHLE